MSDEFNTANRSFRPGDDHLWTSLEKPDGVNGALEVYSHNMTSTKCDDDGTCYFYIEAIDEVSELTVYNAYLNPPQCEPDIFDPKNQRISACDDDPGYGLNKNQGRGAPEIDILEGGGVAISSSLQIAPGMPSDFRLFPAEKKYDAKDIYCVYKYDCETPGANLIDIPTAYYEKERGHKSWYQGLRYASNSFCSSSADEKQDVDTIKASLKAGVTDNTCTAATCPASLDPNSDLDPIGGVGSDHWGINSNGTCFPVMNSYMGSYLCDPDNSDEKCLEPRNSTTHKTNSMESFNYQMDAISANWPVHLGAYMDYFVYQVEWVTGDNGYVRWMGDGQPLFEVTAQAFSVVPQNDKKNNPQKLMLEEPMSIIFNVALSRSWGATPPNPGRECRGDGTDETVNKICDDFPMFLKIDYIRLYQDPKGNRGTDDYMQLGCDPASHPTREWIQGHMDEYEDLHNPWTEVVGKGFCKTDSDCTIGKSGNRKLVTGKCVEARCVCSHPNSWGGPRCTTALAEEPTGTGSFTQRTYGPSMAVSLSVAIVSLISTLIAASMSIRTLNKQAEEAIRTAEVKKMEQTRPSFPINLSISEYEPKDNYSQNFL
ncbi:hypothetical protein PInf_024749 [Phytophthora infestans]|nr:hypothetical protein PInf_024749 [Phytophthora infestans]